MRAISSFVTFSTAGLAAISSLYNERVYRLHRYSTDCLLIKRFAAKKPEKMVEINNQRKAFLDMLAGRRELITGRQKTRNHGYDVIVGGEPFTDYPDSPSQTCHAKPKTQINRRRTLPAFPVADAYRKQFGLKDFSPKSQDAVALQQIKERGALPMIDRGDIRQAIDRCSNIWASLPGAGYGQFEHKADSLIAKFKEAGGTVREIDVWAESPRLSPLWLSASSSACHGLLIITVITRAITYKAQRQKCQRTEAGERGNFLDMQMRQWCCCARCKIHEGVSWC